MGTAVEPTVRWTEGDLVHVAVVTIRLLLLLLLLLLLFSLISVVGVVSRRRAGNRGNAFRQGKGNCFSPIYPNRNCGPPCHFFSCSKSIDKCCPEDKASGV